MSESIKPRHTIDTVVGPVQVMPECERQAVCVNGSKCWEVGACLKSTCERRPGCGCSVECRVHAAAIAQTGGRS